MTLTLFHILPLLAAYLLGAIPFGLIFTRALGKDDLRQIGSGNIGATNAYRAGGTLLGLLTLLFDAGKGAAVVLLTRAYIDPTLAPFAGVAAVLGHIFPVYLRFRGGKGVATTLAMWLALFFPLGAGACAVWLIAFAISRLSALAAGCAMLAAPSIALFYAPEIGTTPLFLTLFLSLLILWRHKENWRRILRGEEKRL